MTAVFTGGGPIDGERRMIGVGSEPPPSYYVPLCFVKLPTPLQHPLPRYRHVYLLVGAGSGEAGEVVLYRYQGQEVY